MEDLPNILEVLTTAAKYFNAPPSDSSEATRKKAEETFLQLRNVNQPLQLIRRILGNTENDFIIHQTVSGAKEALLRRWLVTDQKEIEEFWKLLFHYALEYSTKKSPKPMPSYVVAELLQTISMVLKRGTFDELTGDTDYLFNTLDHCINQGSYDQKLFATQSILSICTEYCTSWRSSYFGIAWDFHMRAKRNFECTRLKQLFQLSLQPLFSMLNTNTVSLGHEHLYILNQFLGIADTVLSWHFGTSRLPKRLTYSIEFSASSALRPPAEWRDVFLDRRLLEFFFKLYFLLQKSQAVLASDLLRKCHNSLVQLASLMGDIFNFDKKQPENAQLLGRPDYIRCFVENSSLIFNENSSRDEVLDFALISWKLMTYHPLCDFYNLPEDIWHRFLNNLARWTCALSTTVTHHEDSLETPNLTQTKEDALLRFFDVWSIFLKSKGEKLDADLFRPLVQEIFVSFTKGVLLPPVGVRPSVANQPPELGELLDEVDEDDRIHYQEILLNLSFFGRFSLETTLDALTRIMFDKLVQMKSFIQKCCTPVEVSDWHEDMHWIILEIGFTLIGTDLDGGFYVQREVVNLSKKYENQQDFTERCTKYIQSCLESPENASPADSALGPVIGITGALLTWFSFQSKLAQVDQRNLLSPQLYSTTLWCLRRVISAFTVGFFSDWTLSAVLLDDDKEDQDKFVPVLQGIFSTGSELSRLLDHLLLTQCFYSLAYWPGEIRIGSDSIDLLLSLVENQERASHVAKNASLFEEIRKLHLTQMSPEIRKSMIRALVLIASSLDDPAFHQQMFDLVIQPLIQRFHNLTGGNTDLFSCQSDLVDIIDCFAGVIQATQYHNAKYLYDFTLPIANYCPKLIERCPESQLVLDSVLQLFKELTSKLAIYLENNLDVDAFYNAFISLLRVYASKQANKYKTKSFSADEEDRASDLVLVMENITNLVSRDLMLIFGTADAESNETQEKAAMVALLGLQIVMPLMNENLLHFPTLCQSFYRLCMFICESYPSTIINLEPAILENFIKCAYMGLTNQYGMEVMRLSLELIDLIGSFVLQDLFYRPLVTVPLKKMMGGFIKPVFEACLSYSCDVEMAGTSISSLFVSICLDKESYEKMVKTLVESHKNPKIQEILQKAFSKLTPKEISLNAPKVTRKEKRDFREKFENFIQNIQGLLCLMPDT